MKTFSRLYFFLFMTFMLRIVLAGTNEPSSSSSPEEIKESMNVHASTIALTPLTSGLEPFDQQFANVAAINSMLEVKLGKLATTHAASMAVQKFGARMVTDHDILNRRLLAIANSKRYRLPDKLDTTAEATLRHFEMLQGSNFDQAYVTNMVAAHREDLVEFRKASRECHDPDLRIFAKQGSRIVEHHLQEIEKIQKSMNDKR